MSAFRAMNWALVAAAISLAGCGSAGGDPVVVDSGIHTDTGTGSDLGTGSDSGTDSGTTTDGGTSPGMCPSTSCDLVANTGCETGQRCSITSTALPVTTACITAGAGTHDVSCTDDTGCAAGFLCVEATCKHVCCVGSTAGECGTGYACDRELTLMGARTGVGICDPTVDCDLDAQTGCPGTDSCILLGQDGSRQCRPSTGTLAENAACETSNDQCAAGLQCLQLDAGPASCRKFCDATAMPTTCPGTETCGRIVVTGMPDLGVCRPPA